MTGEGYKDMTWLLGFELSGVMTGYSFSIIILFIQYPLKSGYLIVVFGHLPFSLKF